ncbi:YciI family protein [Acidovorax sp. NCPPB 2350]|nr:YciI family protein [Acidovorax sp. NCPPB 2350]
MLYAVTLTYIRPLEEIDAHLDSHRDWLVQYAGLGHILVAGPLEPKIGGMVIMHGDSRADVDRILALDSFHIHRLAEYDVRPFDPVLRAAAFPAEWAPRSKAA